MPKVASVDYENKRVYLSAETVGIDLDTLDIYSEVRALRRTNADHRKFRPMVVAGGNVQKTLTTFTPAYVVLLHGCRIVPYDTSHRLCLCRETFTDDNLSGSDVFDRSSLSPTTAVDIDVNVQEVEIRVVQTGGGSLTPEQDQSIKNIEDAMFNRSVLDQENQTLTLYEDDGETVKQVFDLVISSGSVTERTPQ